MTDPPANDWELDPLRIIHGVGEVTDRMDRAAVLCRRDPLRDGNLILLPNVGDAFVVGDLHGDLENFQRILDRADLAGHPDRYLILQEMIHGGPLDAHGGDQSFRLLEAVADLKCRFRTQVHLLLSNHDVCEILGSTITKAGQNASAPFWRGIENAYGDAWPEVHGSYRRMLASLPLAVRTTTGIFISHSTPQTDASEQFDPSVFHRPLTMDDYLPGGSVHTLVWGRNHDQAAAEWFARAVGADVLVTGHQSSMPGVKTPTTRHIILTSDGPLGRFLPLKLSVQVPYHVLVRQVTKIRT